jgi:hypothetical protein
MNTIQKAVLISSISIAAISLPEMMKALMTYDPIAVSLFTISWTVGMAAMMFIRGIILHTALNTIEKLISFLHSLNLYFS